VDSIPRLPTVDDYETALVSGEEFELLVAMPEDAEPDLARVFLQEHSVELTRIGTVTSGAGLLLQRAGEPVAPPAGFRHF
jgi:thiamine monophosphate kinase